MWTDSGVCHSSQYSTTGVSKVMICADTWDGAYKRSLAAN